MSSVVTRRYMQRRMIAVLAGFVAVVILGTGVLLWQAETAKNQVRFGALLGYMADATGDVIYNALRLEHTSMHLMPHGGSHSVAGYDHDYPGTASAEGAAIMQAARKDLRRALARLRAAYDAMELAVGDDVSMLESQRITLDAGDELARGEVDPLVSGIARVRVPESVRTVWEGWN